MDSAGHVATAPPVSGALPFMSRRDLRALENRLGTHRANRPAPAPSRAVPKRSSIRQSASAAGAMAMIALFAIGASLPALAVNPETGQASATRATQTDALQTVSTSSAAAVRIDRGGFTVTEAAKSKSYTESASSGAWSSLVPIQMSDQGWALPVVGRISSPFGPRPNKPVDGVGEYHNGTDIAAPCGRPVFAATGGKIVDAGYQGSYGNWVLIDHGNGVETGYAHNSKLLVDVGQLVVAGEIIAVVGTTGASSGCHVHFETRIDGTRIDAEPFMMEKGISLG
ncbi:M23 family metallopeptidase [Cryobacterium glaciale]|uniref:M23 family metallopeptidase n=1 Tax=Cryobacterium glaciale TaxID=1259145 RepID=A0A4R8US98_9MICO|nr:M23 family metallopeptidase [Cryobacterium glaciale]TFB69107.1 M23 family metallopeptidase [Cryobacterium glaciale]